MINETVLGQTPMHFCGLLLGYLKRLENCMHLELLVLYGTSFSDEFRSHYQN